MKRGKILLLILINILFTSALCWSESAEEHFKMGNIYFFKGQYDKAISEYEKAAKINPKDAHIYSNLGNSYLLKGQYDKAISEYKKASSINPNDATARINLGQAYWKKKKLDEAIAEYKKAIKIAPYDPIPHLNLASLYKEKGMKAEAEKEYAIHKRLTEGMKKETLKEEDVEITDLKGQLDSRGYYYVSGKATNKTNKYGAIIFLVIHCYDKKGNLIGTGFTQVEDVAPGKTVDFEGTVPDVKEEVAKYKVEFDDASWR